MKRKTLAAAAKVPATFEDLVRLYPPRSIRDDVDYRNTQELIDRLTSVPSLSTGQEEYLDTLATLLHAYEEQHVPIDTADLNPADTLKFLLDQRNLTPTDLGRLLGERSLGAKVLRGEAELTQSQIRFLADFFQVNPALFL